MPLIISAPLIYLKKKIIIKVMLQSPRLEDNIKTIVLTNH